MKRLILFSASIVMSVLPLDATATQFETPNLAVEGSGSRKVVLTVSVGEMGAPAGFTIEWMTESDFVGQGGWINPEQASFEGTPTLNSWGVVDSYELAPWASATVEIGDLFDETGVVTTNTDELASGTLFVFRAYVNGDGTTEQSTFSQNRLVPTGGGDDCTLTQGYWKTHEEDWDTVDLDLGMVNYAAAELNEIFDTPAEGNGALILAHQLIAALLNIMVLGADMSPIAGALADAHALLNTCGADPIPPHGTCWIAPEDASPISQILDDFNNSTGDNCMVVSVEEQSWGSVKAGYR